MEWPTEMQGRPRNRELYSWSASNLGDIIIAEDNDIHGDGVNVAARLEGGFTREEAGKIAGRNHMRIFRAVVG